MREGTSKRIFSDFPEKHSVMMSLTMLLSSKAAADKARCALFDKKFTLSRSAIEVHAFAALEALPCV
jgi:hypothetical protein